MPEPQLEETTPPQLKLGSDGRVDTTSLADVIQWFIGNDEKTARIRHPNSNELFVWKQEDDSQNGISTYPFENAEARFAIGSIQAVGVNDSEPLLKLWISDLLQAIGEARETRSNLASAYDLDAYPEEHSLKKAERLPSNAERRLYLTSCWLEVLYTAEARVLGWVYQELYQRPFTPT